MVLSTKLCYNKGHFYIEYWLSAIMNCFLLIHLLLSPYELGNNVLLGRLRICTITLLWVRTGNMYGAANLMVKAKSSPQHARISFVLISAAQFLHIFCNSEHLWRFHFTCVTLCASQLCHSYELVAMTDKTWYIIFSMQFLFNLYF